MIISFIFFILIILFKIKIKSFFIFFLINTKIFKKYLNILCVKKIKNYYIKDIEIIVINYKL